MYDIKRDLTAAIQENSGTGNVLAKNWAMIIRVIVKMNSKLPTLQTDQKKFTVKNVI